MNFFFLTGIFLLTMMYGECLPVNTLFLEECKKELGISEGEKDDSKFRCMNSCFWKKDGYLETAKSLDLDKLRNDMTTMIGNSKAEKFMKKLEECNNEAKNIEDVCDFTNFILKCSNGYIQ